MIHLKMCMFENDFPNTKEIKEIEKNQFLRIFIRLDISPASHF